jgi:hypothetical protein
MTESERRRRHELEIAAWYESPEAAAQMADPLARPAAPSIWLPANDDYAAANDNIDLAEAA